MRSASRNTWSSEWLTRRIARPPVAHPADQVLDAPRLGDAERGGRLVHHDEPLRPVRGARDRDALALAAREVADRLLRAVDAHVELVEQRLRLGRHRPPGRAAAAAP